MSVFHPNNTLLKLETAVKLATKPVKRSKMKEANELKDEQPLKIIKKKGHPPASNKVYPGRVNK